MIYSEKVAVSSYVALRAAFESDYDSELQSVSKFACLLQGGTKLHRT